jgi:hypothetical protein
MPLGLKHAGVVTFVTLVTFACQHGLLQSCAEQGPTLPLCLKPQVCHNCRRLTLHSAHIVKNYVWVALVPQLNVTPLTCRTHNDKFLLAARRTGKALMQDGGKITLSCSMTFFGSRLVLCIAGVTPHKHTCLRTRWHMLLPSLRRMRIPQSLLRLPSFLKM